MKIYRVKEDIAHYQSLSAANRDDLDLDRSSFDCQPRLASWRPPEVYVPNPGLRRGHFLGCHDFASGALAMDEFAMNQLLRLLEPCGEMLPLPFEGRNLYMLNILECVNMLDQRNTQWVYGETGKDPCIQKYAFHPNRWTEFPLFKIPEESKTSIFTVEGLKYPRDEFKFNVERRGLTGLIFIEVWSDGEEPIWGIDEDDEL